MKPPIATYRLQLTPQFGFKEALDILDYLADLGVSHIYLSPCLQAVWDSSHGYDVVDPTHVNQQLGGDELFAHFCKEAKKKGLGIIVDLVPNHMATDPSQNPWWRDFLEKGKASPFAKYFDIDWGVSQLRYRRFFNIDHLVGVRVEDPEVFNATHKLPIQWYKEGLVQGFRIDHPDGLRDPTEYLKKLNEACPGAWILVEKILTKDEKLPSLWSVGGTTGYEFINLLERLFIDPEGEKPLLELYWDFIGEKTDFPTIVYESKLTVLEQLFGNEMDWLTRLLKEALIQKVATFPVYRTYGNNTLLFDDQELSARFQQFTPAVMAKGFEDTALYRYHPLILLNEVGGDPTIFSISIEKFHEECKNNRPYSLLASTTHDTKHSEDFRSRLALIAEIPEAFADAIQRWTKMDFHFPDLNTQFLFYQTLIGAWPISIERVVQYLTKAVREAKVHTTWQSPNLEYEEKLIQAITQGLNHQEFISDFETFIQPLIKWGKINSLAKTLIKLTAPGVPDIYQGSELWNFTLVDPDNRQPVDYTLRKKLLRELNDPKLVVIHKTLRLGGVSGAYTPIFAEGDKKDHVVAFMRGATWLTLVPRFPLRLKGEWGNTALQLPKGEWHHMFTDETFEGKVAIESLLKNFPVVLLQLYLNLDLSYNEH